jgi:hypothetical protein
MGGGGSRRGWTGSRLELAEIQLLDRVQQATRDGEAPTLHAYAKDLAEGDWDVVRTAADNLEAEGLINGNQSLVGSLSPVLTPAGKTLVLQRAERRKNPRKRAIACRDAILDWLYSHNPANFEWFSNDPRAKFEGETFTQDEITATCSDLIDKRYITGQIALAPRRAIVRDITAIGKTIVESYDSSITAYENRNNGGSMINITGDHFSGQLSIGDNNQQTQTNNGVAGSELAELMQAVVDAAKGTEVEDRVNKLIMALQLEADEEQPDRPTIEKTLDRLKAIGSTTASLLPTIGKLADFVQRHL